MPTAKNARNAKNPKPAIVPAGFDPDAAATGDGLFGLDAEHASAIRVAGGRERFRELIANRLHEAGCDLLTAERRAIPDA